VGPDGTNVSRCSQRHPRRSSYQWKKGNVCSQHQWCERAPPTTPRQPRPSDNGSTFTRWWTNATGLGTSNCGAGQVGRSIARPLWGRHRLALPAGQPRPRTSVGPRTGTFSVAGQKTHRRRRSGYQVEGEEKRFPTSVGWGRDGHHLTTTPATTTSDNGSRHAVVPIANRLATQLMRLRVGRSMPAAVAHPSIALRAGASQDRPQVGPDGKPAFSVCSQTAPPALSYQWKKKERFSNISGGRRSHLHTNSRPTTTSMCSTFHAVSDNSQTGDRPPGKNGGCFDG